MADPANRHTNPAGGKYYIHPVTQERFDSVTTICDLIDKAALKQWAGNLAADMALEHLPQLLVAQIEPLCGNTYNRCYEKHGRQETCERCPCGRCGRCWHRRIAQRHSAESKRRADEGTEVHQAINHWILRGGEHIALSDAAQPYFAEFLNWTKDYGLRPRVEGDPGSWEQTEITLLNREFMYAGTSDGAVWLSRGHGRVPEVSDILDRIGRDRVLVRVDYKTREKPDERLFNDMTFQGVAYERCTAAMLSDGREFPAPKTDARFVLQLRPDAYTFRPMLTDDDTFVAFLGVLTAYRFFQRYGTVKDGVPALFDLDTILPVGGPPPVVVPTVTDQDRRSSATLDVLDHYGQQPAGKIVDAVVLDDPWAPSDDPASPGWTGQQLADVVATPAMQEAIKDGPKPRKTAAKKTAKKAAAPVATATLDSMRNFDPGRPDPTALGKPIPF